MHATRTTAALLPLSILLAPALATAQAEPRAPVVWAVVAGIDDYEDPALADCRGAVAEARAIRTMLLDAGWDGDQVLFLGDGARRGHGEAGERPEALAPTLENLRWALAEWLPHRARPGDVVLFAFVGQAAPVRPDPSDAPRGRLLPIDAAADRLDATSWALEDSLDAVASRGQNPVLVWLDTGLAGRGRPALDAPPPEADPYRWLESLARWPGTSAWLAATRGPCREGDGSGRLGPFAEALRAGLGSAESPANLLACLDVLNRHADLSAQGFRSLGGLPTELTLWKSRLQAIPRPEPALLLQRGHADRITSAACTPDGRLITASMDSTIRFWRLEDRALLRTLAAHTVGVTALALGPDGTTLVSGDGAGRVRVWDLSDYRSRTVLGPGPHGSAVRAVAFLPDGRRFVTLGQGDGRLLLWDAAPAELRPRVLLDGVGGLAVGPTGLIAASRSAAGAPPEILLLGPDGDERRRLAGPGGVVAHDLLAIDGRRVAAADRSGKVVVWGLDPGAGDPLRLDLQAPIRLVRLGAGRLAVGVGREVRLIPLEEPATAQTLEATGPVVDLAWSEDGRWFSALTGPGAVHVWRVDGPEAREAVHHPATAERRVTAAAFLPRGEGLVAGEQSGALRGWALPGGEEQFESSARRGKVDALAVSPEGRHLLQITHDWAARIWDLREGRALTVIPGEWTSGAFLPDGRLAMTDRRGDLALVDRDSGLRLAVAFEKPPAEGGGPLRLPLGRVAVSPDGSRLAAATPGGGLVCAWKVEGGPPVWVRRAHEEGVSAVAFAGDSRHLLTAGLEGRALVWDLDDPAWRERPKWSYRADDPENPRPGGAISAAAIAADRPWRVATGQRDGRVLLWDAGPDGALRAEELARFDGEVRAAVFLPDGRRLAVAGTDKTLRLWTLPDRGPVGPPERLLPQHDEQVNALAAWPGGELLASGSDDTTVRFWGLARRPPGEPLLGSLAADDSGAWVAFTPDGQFDGSPGAEAQVAWLVEGRLLPLEQFAPSRRRFHLADAFRGGVRPDAPPASFRPPLLALDPPPASTDRLEATLTVVLGESDLADLRLYRDGVPVRAEDDFEPAGPGRYRVNVRLRPGPNTFYAMASRPGAGSVDGRSNVVGLRCTAPVTPGRTHVLAIGVSEYDRNALRFADHDADAFAARLLDEGVRLSAEPGVCRVLKNGAVTAEAVRSALREIRDACRPDDLVVAFLAGHADVRRGDRFCLLLHDFDFPAGTETTLADRGVVPRGGDAGPAERDESGTTLPFSEIYRVLSRLDARRRLVVIDACQAGAVLDDPVVARVRERCDEGAFGARTSYLLAARTGEPAGESPALGHGLFTYVLLRGLGADLTPEPEGLPGSADLDGDHRVTTEELGQYAATALPRLAAQIRTASRSARSGPEGTDGPGPSVQAVASPAFPIARIIGGSE